MTAHQCCTECGAELPLHGGRLCGCAGPFTAEQADPMHIRPYVYLPQPYHERLPAPDLEPFAGYGPEVTAELPPVLPPEEPRDAQHIDVVEPLAAPRSGRRRPGRVALAAAGVVAALGAGLLSTQMLTDDDGGNRDERSLSKDDSAVPSGGPTDDSALTKQESGADDASASPSRTASSAPRAARDSDDHTGADSAGNSSSAPESSGEGNGDQDRDRDRPAPQRPDRPNGQTLRFGDTGSEVQELQRRLKQAGVLEENAPEDGVYSRDVLRAVAKYQAVERVRGDDFGEYGKRTRRVLESETDG